ncbi:MAG: nucleotidyltransferase domain-containing protein [Nitrospirae bacterium]|nr:nucleotidyltransferase domain-containing protein [Nitrospirota bacterium]
MGYEVIVKTILNFYPDVEAIYLFGTYGTADENRNSDVDIALLLPYHQARSVKNLIISQCCYALEDALKRTIDLINLRMMNTVFQHEIIYEGRVIYEAWETGDYAVDYFEMAVMSSYQKLNQERAGILQEVIKSGRILR